MGERNVKINIEEFELMRKSIKYLDFYWMQYKNINPQATKLTVAPSVENFCKNQMYDQLKVGKINFLRTKATVPESQYEQLKEYTKLTYYVKGLLETSK